MPVSALGQDGRALAYVQDGYYLHKLMRRLFVYEFVAGGGFADDALPPQLLSEGQAMLEALLADLAAAPGRRVVTTVDERVSLRAPPGVEVVRVCPGSGLATFKAVAGAADDVWLIAPETGSRLAELSQIAAGLGTRLVGPNAAAIRHACNKLHLARRLAEAGIAVPRTWPGDEARRAEREIGYPLVVKPAVGAGCEGVGLARTSAELKTLLRAAARTGPAIVQEYIQGIQASVSVLCGVGSPRPLSLNGQDVKVGDSFLYAGGTVPLRHPAAEAGVRLALAACELVPGLAGFVGVDLVLSESEAVVIEINPRLTTSYVGLRAATDVNVAELILGTGEGDGIDPGFPLPLQRTVEFSADGRVRALQEQSG